MHAYGQKKCGSRNGKFSGASKKILKKNERQEAIDKVFKELSSMSQKEFKKELKKYRNGDFAKILLAARYLGL